MPRDAPFTFFACTLARLAHNATPGHGPIALLLSLPLPLLLPSPPLLLLLLILLLFPVAGVTTEPCRI